MSKHRPTPYRTERVATNNLSFAQHMQDAFGGRSFLTRHERYVFERDLYLHRQPRPKYGNVDPMLELAASLQFTPGEVRRVLERVSLIARWVELLGIETIVPERYLTPPEVVKSKDSVQLSRKSKWWRNPDLIAGSVSR